mmetsp:Transcript_16338/g.25396  ORF Transcript_16338/g.25396 Transcript_16338/m.25396 type:complete len:320 (+) Transcript_16338:465-1424(+)|eukprot:CAMPEP_0195289826 /NCGR_PEP_ID=MMETSP0707-20130614/5944_1 /TAXON_ID=33640 /ORGANISM="Asterionellopsis glacialis, Strain CCMP134" /LENGTH=319 /DNA_ID=CAMNT_0040349877 /DNA_START=416 /DNA_END=1375 /DNA_ORIENTATION=-
MKIFFTMLTMVVATATNCDYSVDLLMITNEKGTSFEGNEYKVQARNNGNLQITKVSQRSTIYDNKCYCKPENGNCPGNFEVKLQTDANLFVNPQGGQNIDKVWKNNKPGPQGTYALVVKGVEPQILKFSGSRECPQYGDMMWSSTQEGVCYGNNVPTDPDPCDAYPMTILMTENDRGDEFYTYTNDSHLFVEESGNLVLTSGGDWTMFESKCECENRRHLRELTTSFTCDYNYEVKLQEDGNLIVLPEGQNNEKKIWKSQKTGPIGHYALVHNLANGPGDSLQIYRFNGDRDCPEYYEQIWGIWECAWCKGDNSFCYSY